MPARPKTSTTLSAFVTACALAVAALALTVPSAQATSPGANGRIAFSRCIDGYNCNTSEIWTMAADGSGAARLVKDPGYFDNDPSYSADGRKLVFQRCSAAFDCGIATVDAYGHGLRQLTPGSHPIDDDYPSFSPDSTTIVFNRYTSASKSTQVWIMGADGSNPHPLTSGALSSSSAEFAPDGTKIVFYRYAAGVRQLWLMNADGSNQHALTNSPSREDMAPSFSPDGKQVAFQACVADYCSIWVMGLNGTGARQVTSPAIADARPAFSPDGKRVVFQRSIADGTTRLYSQALSGGTATQVATGYDFKASWGRVPTPSIDTPPTITGAARAGHALTAKAGAAGWGGSASLQWLRCGTTCAVIPGATTVGYRPTNADVGKKLVVRQTQTSAGGSVSADSTRFGPVAREPGALIAKPVKRARKGLLLARVSCPATQSVVCQGKVTLTAIARGRAVKVGSTTFDIAAAKRAAVTLRVSKRARALVAKGHKPRLQALLVTRDDAGNNTIRKQAVALR